jgi:hypothetical protein
LCGRYCFDLLLHSIIPLKTLHDRASLDKETQAKLTRLRAGNIRSKNEIYILLCLSGRLVLFPCLYILIEKSHYKNYESCKKKMEYFIAIP